MANKPVVKPVVINTWQKGIAPSPYLGFADIRNCDILTEPGVLKLTPALQRTTGLAVSGTFTADASTDLITSVANFQINSNSFTTHTSFRPVTLTTTGTLPGGLSTSTVYFITTPSSGSIFKLASTVANAEAGTGIDITNAGSGTHTITSVDMGEPKAWAQDPANKNIFVVDSNGRLWFQRQNSATVVDPAWRLVVGNTLPAAGNGGYGLAIFKGFAIVFKADKADAVDLTTVATTPTWSTNFMTLNQGGSVTLPHPALTGQDDIMYFGDSDSAGVSPRIGSLQQIAGQTFAPGSSSTFTYSTTALQLPNYNYVNCLTELGVNLIIGTTTNNIYPWDRHSASFALPLRVPENNITAIQNINNVLYIAAGARGNVYTNPGYGLSTLLCQIPISLTQIPGSNDAVSTLVNTMTYHRARLFMTVENANVSGVWSYDPATKVLTMENQFSTGVYTDQRSYVLFPIDYDAYCVGWKNGSTFGIDSSYYDSNYFPTSYTGYAISPFYTVGSTFNNQNYTECEVIFDRQLTTGQGARVSYRTSLSDSFTLVQTTGLFDYATYNAVSAILQQPNIQKAINFQVKVELTTGSFSNTTPRVLSVIFR